MSNQWHRLNWLEKLVLFGFLVYLLFFLVHAAACLIYPYDLDVEEGFILNQVKQLRTGHTIYPDLKTYPFTVGNYPPVFQLSAVPFSAILGDHHFIGRGLSILSAVLIGLLIFRIVAVMTKDNHSALIAALFPFAVHYVYSWSVYNRVDTYAILWSLLGLYCLVRNPKNLYIPVLCFTVSLFTKQVMIAAPLTVFLCLLGEQKRRAIKFAIAMVVLNGGIFLLMTLITRGEYFNHLVLYNMNPFHFRDLWNYISNIIRFYWIFLGLALISMVIDWEDYRKCYFVVYFLISCVVAISAGKEGSAVNYLLELVFAGSILMGVSISLLRKTVVQGEYILAGILLFQLLWIPHVPYTPLWYGRTPTFKQTEMADSVERMVHQTPGDILSDDQSLLIYNHRPVLFQPFIMSTLYRQGRWNPDVLLGDIEKKRFSMIILYFPISRDDPGAFERYDRRIFEAIRNNYDYADSRPPYFIHRPRTSNQPPSDF